jgi:membrane associated rhomboid family serine protease
MTPWIKRLIIINAVVFFVTYNYPQVEEALALYGPDLLTHPWTIVTYMFAHHGWDHILFNMLGLLFLGPRVEARLGERAFLGLYFTSGLVGGFLSIAAWPKVPIVGASAAILGVILAYAMFWPRERIYIWGVLPIPAFLLVIIYTAISVLGGLNPSIEPGVAHWGHLGGFIGGFLFLKIHQRLSPAARFRAIAKTPQAPPPAAIAEGADRWRRIDRSKLHPVNLEELDRVLAKLAATGPAGLSGEERAFLNRFSGA